MGSCWDFSSSVRVPAPIVEQLPALLNSAALGGPPTADRIVSQWGFAPLPGFPVELDMAVVGPMARSARDLRLLLSIIADAPIPAEAPPVELKGVKMGTLAGGARLRNRYGREDH